MASRMFQVKAAPIEAADPRVPTTAAAVRDRQSAAFDASSLGLEQLPLSLIARLPFAADMAAEVQFLLARS